MCFLNRQHSSPPMFHSPLSGTSTQLCIAKPEQHAGPDIIMCDDTYLILVTLKTTQNPKLQADERRKNQQRNNPINIYTQLSDDSKRITKYDANHQYGKFHDAFSKHLTKQKYIVIRVCLDYPAGAPTQKWKSGAVKDGVNWKVCIDNTNIYRIVGQNFANQMKSIK